MYALTVIERKMNEKTEVKAKIDIDKSNKAFFSGRGGRIMLQIKLLF